MPADGLAIDASSNAASSFGNALSAVKTRGCLTSEYQTGLRPLAVRLIWANFECGNIHPSQTSNCVPNSVVLGRLCHSDSTIVRVGWVVCAGLARSPPWSGYFPVRRRQVMPRPRGRRPTGFADFLGVGAA